MSVSSDRTSVPLLASFALADWGDAVNPIGPNGLGNTIETAQGDGVQQPVPSSVAVSVTQSGQNDGVGNSIPSPGSGSSGQADGDSNTISVGSHNGAGIYQAFPMVGPALAPFSLNAFGGLGSGGSLLFGSSGMAPNTVTVSGAGNSDGGQNKILVGQSNTGSEDGGQNHVAVGDDNGVNVQITNSLLLDGLGIGTLGSVQSPTALLGGLQPLSVASAPPIHVIFEQLQIIVDDSGNNDGNSNTLADGSNNSGSYDGNNNSGSMGNGNGVSITVVNASGAQIRNQTFHLNISGSGNDDGTSNTVSIGDGNGTSSDGNGNSALVGDNNGVIVTENGAQSGGLPSANFAALNPTASNLGIFQLNGIAAPLQATWEQASLTLSGQGNDLGLNGSFNGNGNVFDVGDQNGVSVSLLLGSGNPGDIVSESVLINVLNSGNNDGNGNFITVGAGNGNSMSPMASLLAGSAWAPAAAPAAANPSLTSPGWSDLSLTNVLHDLAGMLTSAQTLVFESIGITVMNSGNNDGNLNHATIGSYNGGGSNGNGNSLLIGSNDGVLIHV